MGCEELDSKEAGSRGLTGHCGGVDDTNIAKIVDRSLEELKSQRNIAYQVVPSSCAHPASVTMK